MQVAPQIWFSAKTRWGASIIAGPRRMRCRTPRAKRSRRWAKAKNGQWIYLFRPELTADRGLNNPNFVQTGVLRSEKLVNMAKHQYRLEPNVSFTPDQKWVVFRSNMFGETYVFAVSVEKEKGQ